MTPPRVVWPVLLFAGARALAETDQIEVALAAGATAAEVLEAIGESTPQLRGLLPSCRLAVDRRYAAGADVVPVEAELALIPPVSGG
jgi:molybdopterin converting factor small subunit